MSYMVNKKKSTVQYNVITEKDTGLNIVLIKDNKDPYVIVRKLNLGSGFNGWTPNFFAMPLSYKYQ